MAEPTADLANAKPLITEAELARDFKHVLDELDRIEAEAAEAVPPSFEDDDDLAACSDFGPKLQGRWKRIEELRVQTKKPFDNGGSTVQAFFKACHARLDAIANRHHAEKTRYLKAKAAKVAAIQAAEEAEKRKEADRLAQLAREEAERGNQQAAARAESQAVTATAAADKAAATATQPVDGLKEVWNYRIVDKTKIDGFALLPYFTAIELDSAIARAVKAGLRKLAGVEIYSDQKAK